VIELSRILCAVDFSRPARTAFARALALSREHNAELTVVQAVPVTEPFNLRGRARMTHIAALRHPLRYGLFAGVDCGTEKGACLGA
jgi:nucleotide-binding universal stress UspA family protein